MVGLFNLCKKGGETGKKAAVRGDGDVSQSMGLLIIILVIDTVFARRYLVEPGGQRAPSLGWLAPALRVSVDTVR